jgi:hypothetical protein
MQIIDAVPILDVELFDKLMTNNMNVRGVCLLLIFNYYFF